MTTIPTNSISYILSPPLCKLRRWGVENDERPSSSSSGSTKSSETPKKCHAYLGHCHAISRLAICHKSRLTTSGEVQRSSRLFTASRDSTIREWVVDGKARVRRVFLGHSNWVNDIATVQHDDGVVIVSASNDTTVKIWNSPSVSTHQRSGPTVLQPSATLSFHSDYVTSVSTASKSSPCLVASAGADLKIFISDLARASPVLELNRKSIGSLYPTQLVSNEPKQLECRMSISSLQLSPFGHFLASSAARELMIWDTRTAKMEIEIPNAHDDLIRKFLVSNDGRHGISSSYDGSVSLWDFRSTGNGPYQFLDCHSDSVWGIWADPENHNLIFTGDRQGNLFGFKKSGYSECACFWTSRVTASRESSLPEDQSWQLNSVLDVAYDTSAQQLWASSGDSTVACWDLSENMRSLRSKDDKRKLKQVQEKQHNKQGEDKEETQIDKKENQIDKHQSELNEDSSFNGIEKEIRNSNDSIEVPPTSMPTRFIPGFPKLQKVRILRDQQTAVTQSVLFYVDSWNIVKGVHLESYGYSNFDEVVDKLDPFVSIAAWCSADVVLGSLRISLKAPSAFSAEILTDIESNVPRNLGCDVLDRLFGPAAGYGTFMKELPPPKDKHSNCSISLLEINSSIYGCLSCELSAAKLNDCTTWVTDWVLSRKIVREPSGQRDVTVCFVPHPKSELPSFPKSQFTCPRWTTVLFVQEYIMKAVCPDAEGSGVGGSGVPGLQLTCMGYPLEIHWDMGTVKDLVWKKNQIKGKAKRFEIFYDLEADPKKLPSSKLTRMLRRKPQSSASPDPDNT